MNQYVTGTMIKRLREKSGLTQQQFAERVGVSDKAVSKWETGRGYPDISLIEPLSATLGVSVIELLSGESVVNTNRASNMLRLKLYVCPICGNVIQSAGEAVVCCCGLTLPALEAEEPDGEHPLRWERLEDEYYVSVAHDMSRGHHISFLAAVRDDGFEMKKLYPEGGAEARFPMAGIRFFLAYCNRHGLFKVKVR
ncbi:MAG: helix-turn-helix domain-containing protein [Oscillospiraceae bacterium]|nr:helix-turn-helix domain-containing protein [Oscillospiraceae bacterium]